MDTIALSTDIINLHRRTQIAQTLDGMGYRVIGFRLNASSNLFPGGYMIDARSGKAEMECLEPDNITYLLEADGLLVYPQMSRMYNLSSGNYSINQYVEIGYMIGSGKIVFIVGDGDIFIGLKALVPYRVFTFDSDKEELALGFIKEFRRDSDNVFRDPLESTKKALSRMARDTKDARQLITGKPTVHCIVDMDGFLEMNTRVSKAGFKLAKSQISFVKTIEDSQVVIVDATKPLSYNDGLEIGYALAIGRPVKVIQSETELNPLDIQYNLTDVETSIHKDLEEVLSEIA